MTADLPFSGMLSQERLEDMRTKNNFRHLQPLEKLMLDYEIIRRVQDEIPDCAVKGGTAVQLHLKDDGLRRLSEDVDMVTSCSRNEVSGAIERLSSSWDWFRPKPHTPRKKDPRKDLPLLTYYCKYRSVTGEPADIKLEIFYGSNMSHVTERTDPATEIFGTPIGFSIPIYSREELIGDKMTTLPLQTIGVGKRRKDIPKHIYDIATLLKSDSEETSVAGMVDGFKRTSDEELSYMMCDRPTYDDILQDIRAFPRDNILNLRLSQMNNSYIG